jgi:hypothetical protein
MRERLHVKRTDNLLLIVLKRVGIIGVDVATGRVLWKEKV